MNNLTLSHWKQNMEQKDIISEEWKIYYKDIHVFSIKESLIPNAGYGCFAGQNYKANQIIGLYHGDVWKKNQQMTPYLMESSELKVILGVKCGIAGKVRNMGSPFYFGLHFCNDAKRCPKQVKAAKQTKNVKQTMRNSIAVEAENNVTACPDFWIQTKTEIKKGEEIFLSYNDGPGEEEIIYRDDD